MFEVEQKYRVGDEPALRERLSRLGAVPGGRETHVDTYYNHPCRDFATTREALRIRRIDGRPRITYKGVKLPGDIKARRELEWPLDPGDPDGDNAEELLRLLGFREVAVVRKRRESFLCPQAPPLPQAPAVPDDENGLGRPEKQAPSGGLLVTIDDVERLGTFAEIEATAMAIDDVAAARDRVAGLAAGLALRAAEQKSYLRLLVEKLTESENV